MNNRIQAVLNKLTELVTATSQKQDKLYGTGSEQNIKTINQQNVLGSGNIAVSDGVSPTIDVTDISSGYQLIITDARGIKPAIDILNGTDGNDGVDGNDGISPTITVSEISGGHRLIVTDSTGQKPPIDILNGVNGQNGTDGQNGQDGNGIVSVAKTNTVGNVDTYTITYTNGSTSTFNITNGINGQNGEDGADGADGADGFSPIISISEIENGHRIIITDADGQKPPIDVLNGADGDDGTQFAPGSNIQLINGVLSTKDSQLVTVDCSSISEYTVSDEKTYVLTNPSTLSINVSGNSERHFFVVCGSSEATITIPDEWGATIPFDVNTTVEISVLNGKAVYKVW